MADESLPPPTGEAKRREYYRKRYASEARRTYMKQYLKEWRAKNIERARAIQRNYKARHPERHREHERKRRENYPERAREIARRSFTKNFNTNKQNIQFQLSLNLRRRLNVAVRQNTRAGSSVSDLGCSIEQFKKYIEGKFVSGMTWESWGRGKNKWHLDHIKPLAAFDLANREQFLEACHFTNYQPLWGADNVRKGARILPEA